MCNGTVVTPVVINGVPTNVTGTNNLDYVITDGKGNVVIDPGFNVIAGPIVLVNPRVDDPNHSDRLLSTSGASPGDISNPTAIAANAAGAFLSGTADPATVGNRLQVQFTRTGRFLVICSNRAHFLNDHEFGFVSVTDPDK